MPQSLLRQASRLYRRRRFAQVIRLLESQIFRFRENTEFFKLLGCSCLRQGDLGGAESYLRRANQLQPQDAATLLGLAAIHLKRGESEPALELWLQVLESGHADRQASRRASRGLELLRRAAAAQDPQLLQDARRIFRLLPAVPFNARVLLLPLAAAAAAALLAAGIVLLPAHLPRRTAGGRPEVREVRLSAGQPTLDSTPAAARYPMTERQIQESFEKTKRFLLQYRDNLAQREVNRILLSNASAYVKEKAKLLATFTRVPDFSTVRDAFEYREVAVDPPLHAGCYVVWKGKVANLALASDRLAFDLLVGYESQQLLQGVVPVAAPFAAELGDGDAVEVLGRVGLPSGKLALEAVSLHRLYSSP
jgi:tetratricopeptide (TPR) repeat protein